MDADLGGGGVVRSESNRSALLPRDLLPPPHRERRIFVEIRAMDLGGERGQIVLPVICVAERERTRLHCESLCGGHVRFARETYSPRPPPVAACITFVTFCIAADVTRAVPAAITSSPLRIPNQTPTPTPSTTAA